MSEEPRRAGRRGRPWGPLQGGTAEISELAQLLRNELDASGMTLGELYDRLVPEHFSSGHVPARSTLARRLSGHGLESDWEIVEAIIDVTSGPAPARPGVLLQARQLWNAARRNPTPAPTEDGTPDESPDGTPDRTPDGTPDERATEGRQAAARAATPVSFHGTTFHGSVNITNNTYYSAAEEPRQGRSTDGEALVEALVEAQRQVIDLQKELLASRRRLFGLADRLNRSHLALATVMRVLDEAPPGRAVDGLRREVAEALQQSDAEEEACDWEVLHHVTATPEELEKPEE
ncbi:hypothetical protein [Streptomyces sp. URMC 124]|uniref:hypothetical protein n=1 Tax=Streptomyces sp. URMC 124 TaxID=3423405 RepID=UPI003F1C4ECF